LLRSWEAALKELKSENVTTWIREIPDPRFGENVRESVLKRCLHEFHSVSDFSPL
jgi:hypothetical protein